MVVYEIKDPGAVVTTARPKPSRTDLEPAVAAQHIHVIGTLLGRHDHGKGKEGRHGRRMVALDQAAVREVCRLIDQINHQLEAHGALIHLVLVADDEGIAIDLYDCSDKNVCRVIHDISIRVNDLPVLLAKLTEKVGIMVDTLL